MEGEGEVVELDDDDVPPTQVDSETVEEVEAKETEAAAEVDAVDEGVVEASA